MVCMAALGGAQNSVERLLFNLTASVKSLAARYAVEFRIPTHAHFSQWMTSAADMPYTDGDDGIEVPSLDGLSYVVRVNVTDREGRVIEVIERTVGSKLMWQRNIFLFILMVIGMMMVHNFISTSCTLTPMRSCWKTKENDPT